MSRPGGRRPLAGPHTIEVARAKAYTSNTFQPPTSALSGRAYMAAIPGVLLSGGGLPVQAWGVHCGAVGVSGAPARATPGDVDQACTRAGVAAMKDDLGLTGP